MWKEPKDPPRKGCVAMAEIFARIDHRRRRGKLFLCEPEKTGVCYVSSFGPNSDLSFSGFLPGILSVEDAKVEVVVNAEKYLGSIEFIEEKRK